uniref:Uncharacterized protein n=1 Tax=Arundo donax TaxID=35708 RepID=A0A0A9AFT0_ARUDO
MAELNLLDCADVLFRSSFV